MGIGGLQFGSATTRSPNLVSRSWRFWCLKYIFSKLWSPESGAELAICHWGMDLSRSICHTSSRSFNLPTYFLPPVCGSTNCARSCFPVISDGFQMASLTKTLMDFASQTHRIPPNLLGGKNPYDINPSDSQAISKTGGSIRLSNKLHQAVNKWYWNQSRLSQAFFTLVVSLKAPAWTF